MFAIAIVFALGMSPQEWYTYAPEGTNIQVQLPQKPGSVSSRSVTNSAGKAQVSSAELKTSKTLYMVQISDVGKSIDPNSLDSSIRRFSTENKGTIGPLKSFTVDGNPGREFEMTQSSSKGDVRSKVRWIVAGKKLIMLTAAGMPGIDIPSDSDRFLESLKFGAKNAVAKAESKDEAKDKDEAKVEAKADAKSEDGEMVEEKAKAAEKKKATPTKFTISKLPKSAKPYAADQIEDLKRSFVPRESDGFRDVGAQGSVLVGVRASYIEHFGGPKVRSVQPIYRLGTKYYEGKIYGELVPPVQTFVCRPGYAVGGLVTHTGLTVDGFRLVFMKVDGDKLDPNDRYESAWIGDVKGGGPGEVYSTGDLVVGLQGRASNEVFALGLTTLK